MLGWLIYTNSNQGNHAYHSYKNASNDVSRSECPTVDFVMGLARKQKHSLQ